MSETPPTPPEAAARLEAFFDRPPPPGYLEDWAERLAQPPDHPDHDLQAVVVFRLNTEWLALPAPVLAEVTPPRPVHAIPHRTNRVLLGLVTVRGQLRLAASLHGLLDVAPEEAGPDAIPRWMILQDGGEQWVCAAEEVVGIHRVPREALRAVPSTFPRSVSFTRAVFERDGRTVGLLDPGVLFAALRSHCQ